jgi:hypothetical protein
MKKVIGFLVIIVIIVGIIWYTKSAPSGDTSPTSSSTPVSVPETETSKVSGNLLEYKNAELGFAVKYPSVWEAGRTDTGVNFVIPIDKAQVSTLAKLQADVNAIAGKCTFPPVTTVKERTTVTTKDKTFNMISMTNTVQGRTYFNRMYSLQKDSICYMFALATITQSPASKNLTGSNATQAENNNKAIIQTVDTAFTDMVKSFEFVTGPSGVDETKAAPAK